MGGGFARRVERAARRRRLRRLLRVKCYEPIAAAAFAALSAASACSPWPVSRRCLNGAFLAANRHITKGHEGGQEDFFSALWSCDWSAYPNKRGTIFILNSHLTIINEAQGARLKNRPKAPIDSCFALAPALPHTPHAHRHTLGFCHAPLAVSARDPSRLRARAQPSPRAKPSSSALLVEGDLATRDQECSPSQTRSSRLP